MKVLGVMSGGNMSSFYKLRVPDGAGNLVRLNGTILRLEKIEANITDIFIADSKDLNTVKFLKEYNLGSIPPSWVEEISPTKPPIESLLSRLYWLTSAAAYQARYDSDIMLFVKSEMCAGEMTLDSALAKISSYTELDEIEILEFLSK